MAKKEVLLCTASAKDCPDLTREGRQRHSKQSLRDFLGSWIEEISGLVANN